MSTAEHAARVPAPTGSIRARHAGFWHDVRTVAGRALRSLPRDIEGTIPPLIVGIFFFAVVVAALGQVIQSGPGLDYEAFQLPVAMLFSLTGLSRAPMLVIDIQSGYLDRLAVTPVHRLALLLGLMVADLVLMFALGIGIVAVGFIAGVGFETGPLGVLAFIALAAGWGLAYTGFPYAIALKTGNPAAVNSSFLLFLPFVFLTTSYVPLDYMSGWLEAAATLNPVTYLLEGMRSLITEGWEPADIAGAVAAIAGAGAVGTGLALAALRGRVSQD
ncbi:MAG: ABC transporter permease [Solirubrobacterales bacterium]